MFQQLNVTKEPSGVNCETKKKNLVLNYFVMFWMRNKGHFLNSPKLICTTNKVNAALKGLVNIAFLHNIHFPDSGNTA